MDKVLHQNKQLTRKAKIFIGKVQNRLPGEAVAMLALNFVLPQSKADRTGQTLRPVPGGAQYLLAQDTLTSDELFQWQHVRNLSPNAGEGAQSIFLIGFLPETAELPSSVREMWAHRVRLAANKLACGRQSLTTEFL
jgi:hypothetical protein